MNASLILSSHFIEALATYLLRAHMTGDYQRASECNIIAHYTRSKPEKCTSRFLRSVLNILLESAKELRLLLRSLVSTVTELR
jgi:hypothetical protein